MFVYQRKINNKDGIVFVSESVDQGKQLPIINGPAYVVYETEDGKIVAESVEFADGEIDNTSKYFYEVLIYPSEGDVDFKLTPLPKKYVINDPIVDSGDISDQGFSDLVKQDGDQPPLTLVPVVTPDENQISARTSGGYELDIDLDWMEDSEDQPICATIAVGHEEAEGPIPDFYDKEVDGKPATDITISCGDSTVTVTYVYDENA